MEEINELENQFKGSTDQINKIRGASTSKSRNYPTTKNWYPQPSLVDIQYEEKYLETAASYSGEAIYEWNIDDFTDHQVFRILEKMTMATTVYRTKNNTPLATAKLLIAGFTRRLKGRWDNDLREIDKQRIYTSLKNEIINDQPV